ncbi:alginate export family protein [Stakelama saccharophila]|uniref:Alginate export family protein n=1 Tax=Stakelama saccharophila TaxID=3075605 RepID=A0ABZ0B818_9SPHN|nr:alginate export family protein [Stakelama sp. W311]WNO53155.1 alginate export family protein [Stakelama sp. W311]
MPRRTLPLFLLFAVAATPALAQDKGGLTVEGSIRARYEALDGQFRPDAGEHDDALLIRSDVLAEYRTGGLRIGGELIDSRSYFEDHDSAIGTTEVNALEPVQAYIGADLSDRASVKLGRFTMALGSQRLVARARFRNTTNAFTGARFDWKSHDGLAATLFWTMPQRRLPDDGDGVGDNDVEWDEEGSARQFFGGDVRLSAAGGHVELYAYRLAEHDAPGFASRDRKLWTIGGRYLRKPSAGAFDYDVEAAWQSGTTRLSSHPDDRTDRSVDAALLHAGVGHSFGASWDPRVAVLFDYASGDGSGEGYGRFDSLFGSRKHDFGPTSLFGPVSRSNLISPALRVQAKPAARLSVDATARLLWLASATDSFAHSGVRDPSGASGRHAGTQIDAGIRYWLIPDRLSLDGGAALLAKGRFLKEAPAAPGTGDTHYAYISLTALL